MTTFRSSIRVVEKPAGERGREHPRDPREEDDRQDRLLPRLGGLVGVVPKRRERRPRMSEHGEGADPPVPPQRTGRLRGGAHAASVLLRAMPETALVVEVPEAEPLVSQWRAQHDWSAQRGVPAHITILYPFAPPSATTMSASTT